MNIILTAINAKYIHSNLAVYSLRAYADRYREEIRVREYTINQPLDDILMDLYEAHPDVVCFSCYLWNIQYVEQIITELAKVLPGVKIWLGGPEVSYDAPQMMRKYPVISGVICGEGEETFRELADHFHGDGKELRGIRGIVFRDEDGAVIQNESRPVMDLNRIPFVYEDLENFRNRIIYYESSRGCPFSCSYGQYITINAGGEKMPTRSKMRKFPSGNILPELLMHIIVHSCGTMMPLALFRRIGGYDTSLRCGHDYRLALELAVQANLHAVEDPVFLRRRHGSNLSSVNYEKTGLILSVMTDFAEKHPEIRAAFGPVIRKRIASLHGKLAREAKRESLPPEVIRRHLETSLKTAFSLKVFFRYLVSLCG